MVTKVNTKIHICKYIILKCKYNICNPKYAFVYSQDYTNGKLNKYAFKCLSNKSS